MRDEDRRIIEQGLARIRRGDEFTVPDLFGKFWEDRTNLERQTIGKAFKANVLNGEYDFLRFVRIGSKDRAMYRRIRNRR